VSAEAAFAQLVRELTSAHDDVQLGGQGKRGFGSDALATDGKIFAMVTGGALVLKLPRQRVEELVADSRGAPFQLGKRVMKEWVALTSVDLDTVRPLIDEAHAFVTVG
jgi:TfoX/Sxy family transcriptional regulator of competence genes